MEVGRLKAVRCYHKDIEASRAKRRGLYAANRDVHINRVVRRNKRLARATPKWADTLAILQIYTDCRRISRESGVDHEVDHHYPISGKEVCGLHTPENLRIVPASVNRRKWAHMPEKDCP